MVFMAYCLNGVTQQVLHQIATDSGAPGVSSPVPVATTVYWTVCFI